MPDLAPSLPRWPSLGRRSVRESISTGPTRPCRARWDCSEQVGNRAPLEPNIDTQQYNAYKL